MISKAKSKQPRKEKSDLSYFCPSDLKPTPENELLYDGFGAANADDAELVTSVRANGVLEPIRITIDHYVISGHRRHAAAKAARKAEIPCVVEPIKMADLSKDERIKLLRKFNLQREKTPSEKIREALADVDPDDAYSELIQYRIDRQTAAEDTGLQIELGERKTRAAITTFKFLHAVQKVIESNKEFWPLTIRRVHYLLLNDPPLKHDKKPESTYQNNQKDYKTLSNLLIRARLTGDVPLAAIDDETRPVSNWRTFAGSHHFIRSQADNLLRGYWRNLLQGQPKHVEILLEKNALRTVVEKVAMDYTMTLTTGKGYASLTPRWGFYQRWKKAGCRPIVLLVLTDFDPDGEQIAVHYPRSMRDDFGIEDITAIKVALTADDVRDNNLPSDLEAKKSSPNYAKFVAKYGTHVAELDAAPVEFLQKKLRDAIESVIDVNEFNRQVQLEKQDQQVIEAQRRVVLESLAIQGGEE